MRRRYRHPKLVCRLAYAEPTHRRQHRLTHYSPRSSQPLPLRLRPCEARLDPLGDPGSLELAPKMCICGFPAGRDASHFTMHGIPAVIFGPGDLRNAHSVDEYVLVDEYLKCIETPAHTILDWCGVL